MPNELDIDVCPRCVWRSVPKATGVCAGCGYPVAEIDSLRARLDAAEELIEAQDSAFHAVVREYNNRTSDPYRSRVMQQNTDEARALVKEARSKWEAVK